MVNLSSEKIEQKLLSLFFHKPYHSKAVSIGLETFSKISHRKLAELIQKYVIKYKQPPTKDTLSAFGEELIQNKHDLEDVSDAILLIDELPKSEPTEFEFYLDKAENLRVGRKIFDMAEYIKEKFDGGDNLDFREIHKNLSKQIITIQTQDDKTKRGFTHETVENRWDKYKKKARGEDDNSVIPYGINQLDDALGGMGRTFLTLVYSKTGGGKTRTMINIAINAAIAGYNVVYFSLEMEFDLLASCIDSRLALVDSNHILFGKLSKEDKKAYKKTLVEQAREKLGIWIVDIPSGARTMDIRNETGKFRAATGLEPDLLVVDYANLVEPTISYNGRSEKYDFLFKEFHEIAREEKAAFLTATMESRDASKFDKKHAKKKDEDGEGVDNIGLSNYIAPHCETIMRIKQNKFDKLQNRAWFIIDKYRYGAATDMISVTARWDLTYVGDKLVPGSGTKLIKENNHE